MSTGLPATGTRRTARRKEILTAAIGIVSAEGCDALTMRRVAEELGMRAPSLYKHLRDKDELIAALQEHALTSVAVALESVPGDLASIAAAYRSWALANPALYELASGRPLARDRIDADVETRAAAPIVAAASGDEDKARMLWAAAHGLVDLELHGRFPPEADLDAAWAVLVRAFS